ncbi:LysE family translocator [Elstera cyanobacteriorum]|uniref:LysE family translocator n=1 Tax=Elstera cyanobacteriorum TaxID=2022747 RepID=UPI00235569EA|nr:LysE family translocator [Elstera cyanobacteriorum]MCK6441213.1 LysE family translocator [Elstera cyanobacteriorum]
MGIHGLWLFILAGALLNVTPGPDMALVIARSTQHGPRAGIAAALGIGVGTFFHIAAAAVGISALILASAWAFTAVKWVGALYLIYLGIQTLRATFSQAQAAAPLVAAAPASLAQIFRQGVLTNALNPKVAIFFLAFLPQFVDADAPSTAMVFLTLGLIFDVVGTLWNVAVALAAGWLAATAPSQRLKLWLERGIGALFVGVGVKLALSGRD